jgi:hypothetical protein
MGWLLSVQAPGVAYRQLYATVADTLEQARLQVFNYCSLTNETIRIEIFDGRGNKAAGTPTR